MKKNNRKPVIEVIQVSKKYSLADNGFHNVLLRDEISAFFKNPLKKIIKQKGKSFWALKNVSFTVSRGEVIGVIGPNGAGKSTLLKILSRITHPTEGKIILRGRVASLLEVGTGFNPELTGRENIYLNGTILGMKRKEIENKFDEIVDFAEIRKFLDVPVKRYSSGMYIRLAFSIAAHLNSEILLVDEVLAVGDARFQRKSLGKMNQITDDSKRTIIFVSHDLNAIKNLCRRTILIQDGRVVKIGETGRVIDKYLQDIRGDVPGIGSRFNSKVSRRGSGEIVIDKIKLVNEQGKEINSVSSGDSLRIKMYFKVKNNVKIKNLLVGLLFKTELGSPVFLSHNIMTNNKFEEISGSGQIDFLVSRLPLTQGNYNVNFSLMKNNGLGGEYYDNIDDAFTLRIESGNFYGSAILPSQSQGAMLVDAQWKVKRGGYDN